MAKKSTPNVRISLEIKHMIKTLYSSFGITITDAINMFLQIADQLGLCKMTNKWL